MREGLLLATALWWLCLILIVTGTTFLPVTLYFFFAFLPLCFIWFLALVS